MIDETPGRSHSLIFLRPGDGVIVSFLFGICSKQISIWRNCNNEKVV